MARRLPQRVRRPTGLAQLKDLSVQHTESARSGSSSSRRYGRSSASTSPYAAGEQRAIDARVTHQPARPRAAGTLVYGTGLAALRPLTNLREIESRQRADRQAGMAQLSTLNSVSSGQSSSHRHYRLRAWCIFAALKNPSGLTSPHRHHRKRLEPLAHSRTRSLGLSSHALRGAGVEVIRGGPRSSARLEQTSITDTAWRGSRSCRSSTR